LAYVEKRRVKLMQASAQNASSPTPFLKWAGGKRSLVAQILEHVPKDIDTYYEPFLGAGSLFFSLPSSLPKVVSDFNVELISVYEIIRDDVDGVLADLRKFRNTKEDYLAARAWDRSPGFARRSAQSRAARFIFLNKCGFNGLYRVNSLGQYNVPYGNPKTVDFIAEQNLRAVSEFLNAKKTRGGKASKISSGDYREILKKATGVGSLVYFDPPYHPTSQTSNFTSYSSQGFGELDQIQLRDEAVRLTKEKVRVLISNSDTDFIRNLYKDRIFRINELSVRRAIAAKSSSRGVITEVLIDNFKAIGRG
jgi:DNA adenine methylase